MNQQKRLEYFAVTVTRDAIFDSHFLEKSLDFDAELNFNKLSHDSGAVSKL